MDRMFAKDGSYVVAWSVIAVVVLTLAFAVVYGIVTSVMAYQRESAACLARGGSVVTIDGRQRCGLISISFEPK